MNRIVQSYKNEAALQKSAALWQKRLAIQDWTVETCIIRAERFDDSGVFGTCHLDRLHRFARVSVLDPIDYEGGFLIEYDAEKTLVHELLHVVLAPLTPQEEDTPDALEVIINQLADALVASTR